MFKWRLITSSAAAAAAADNDDDDDDDENVLLSVGGLRRLIRQLGSGVPHPVDERTFDDLVVRDVDEWVNDDTAVRHQDHHIGSRVVHWTS